MRRESFHIKAVLFDFDGTLTKPGALDFAAIKKTMGCPVDKPILEHIESLSEAKSKKTAFAILDDFETQGAAESVPNDDAEEIVRHLRSKGLPVGIITRNGLQPVRRALENFKAIQASDFDIIVSREDPAKPKPSEEGVLLAARRLGVEPDTILMVGDYLFDIQAGNRAGAVTVLLENEVVRANDVADCDFAVSRLNELKEIVRLGLPIAGGKLPNSLLGGFLKDLDLDDPSLLVRPSIGEDTAAIGIEGEDILVLKTDPITFVTDALGFYSVVINSNDIATSGAVPRWFLATLLFPSGTTPSQVLQVMQELADACRKIGATLCGGHTEVTNAVSRPVVVGSMIGTVAKSGLIDKRSMKPGHKILITKGVAVEGTAIIASEFGERLLELGMSENDLQRCGGFLTRLSILPEARIASGFEGVSAMHDVTEGGLATALEELSQAGGYGFEIELDSIPVFPETRKICRLLNINPLGLIGSGSLIICCPEIICTKLMQTIEKEGIDIVCIGEIRENGPGILAKSGGRPTHWPDFEADELTRLF